MAKPLRERPWSATIESMNRQRVRDERHARYAQERRDKRDRDPPPVGWAQDDRRKTRGPL